MRAGRAASVGAGVLLLLAGVAPLPAAAQAAPVPSASSVVLTVGTSASSVPGRTQPVQGHLLTPEGEAVAGAAVELHEVSDGSSRLVAVGATDDSGTVLFEHAPADRAVLELRAAGSTARTGAVPVGRAEEPTALRAAVVEEDRALRVSFTPLDEPASRVSGYEVRVGDRRTRVPAAGGEVLVEGLANGTSYPVGVRPVTPTGLPAESTVEATPRATGPRPSAGSVLCGRVTGRGTVVRGSGSPYRLCAAGLTVGPGARLTLDAAEAPLVVHSDGAPLVVRDGDLRTTGTTDDRRVLLDAGTAPSTPGIDAAPTASRTGTDGPTLDLQHLRVVAARQAVRARAVATRLRDLDVDLLPLGETAVAVEGTLLLQRGRVRGPSGSSAGRAASATCGEACQVAVTDLDVADVGTALSVTGGQRLRLQRLHVARTGKADGAHASTPPVQLLRVPLHVGPGQDVDELTGEGNGLDAVLLDGRLTGDLTWTTPVNRPDRHPLGYQLGRLVAGPGSRVVVPPAGVVASAAGSLELEGATLVAGRGAQLTSVFDTAATLLPCPSATCEVGPGQWSGISAAGASVVTLDGAVVRAATQGLSVGADATATLVDTTVEDSTAALSTGTGRVDVSGSRFRRLNSLASAFPELHAGLVLGPGTTVRDSVVTDVRGTGIRLSGSELVGTTVARTEHSGISGDATGARLRGVRVLSTGTAAGNRPAVSLTGRLRLGTAAWRPSPARATATTRCTCPASSWRTPAGSRPTAAPTSTSWATASASPWRSSAARR